MPWRILLKLIGYERFERWLPMTNSPSPCQLLDEYAADHGIFGPAVKANQKSYGFQVKDL
jgi:hypothetical protein